MVFPFLRLPPRQRRLALCLVAALAACACTTPGGTAPTRQPRSEPAHEAPPAPSTSLQGSATPEREGAAIPPSPSSPAAGATPEATTPLPAPRSLAPCDDPPTTPPCVVAALDPSYAAMESPQPHGEMPAVPALRARARQQVIDALDALGADDRALAHVEAFIADYPRDRRSNGYRIRVAKSQR